MDKLFAGPVGILLVLAQAGFFLWLLRGLFVTTQDDGISASYRPRKPRRGARRPQADAEADFQSRGRAWTRMGSTLEAWVDASSGAMTARILFGPFAGHRLEDLSRKDCEALYGACLTSDPEAASFLEAYMHRRFAGETFSGARARKPPPPPPPDADGQMTREGAYAALGLAYGASDADILKAYRAMMKKHHPDHGGSTAAAARINQAKDLLYAR